MYSQRASQGETTRRSSGAKSDDARSTHSEAVLSSTALVSHRVSKGTAATTPLRKLGRVLKNLGIAVLMLYMAFQAFKSWSDIYHLQADRLQGNTQQSSKEDYVTFYSAGKMALH